MNELVYGLAMGRRAEKPRSHAVAYLKTRIAALHPAYFALVMATGIVSIGCHLLGLKELAILLFWINASAYGILWLLYVLRASIFTGEFVRDWFSHKRAFGFFTLVAATNVLGSQASLLANNQMVAEALWWLGLSLWTVCTYSIFIFLIIAKDKPSIEEGINGGWLVAVVATQSICVLGCLIYPEGFGSMDVWALILLSFWLFGGMLYTWFISLIMYRYMFFRFEASDLAPPYWINMG
ncbi:MAG: tellurite resistance/C4-dicarboxylate transporter family protein, partial [Candidatus Obscuribacterales bacterium]|nr:tellurite resistance/C4-dicarboxylate transporter family protein [Candidatus Obscuribacterales bacterium]